MPTMVSSKTLLLHRNLHQPANAATRVLIQDYIPAACEPNVMQQASKGGAPSYNKQGKLVNHIT